MCKEKYYLKYRGSEFVEVTKKEFIEAERAAGFQPKLPSTHDRYMKVLATGGFTSSSGIEGKISYKACDDS